MGRALHIWYVQAVVVLALACLVACERVTSQDTVPPSAPVFLEVTSADIPSSRGIGAVSEGDWIRIEWVVGREEDLAGYDIYRRSEDESAFSLICSLPKGQIKEVGPDTAFWRDKSVQLLIRYFYRLRAFDSAGNRSDFSNTVDYRLLSKVIPIRPKGEIEEKTPEFEFQWGDNPEEITSYLLRLVDSRGCTVWISRPVLPVGYETNTTVGYNFDSRATIPMLSSGAYRWRVEAIGADPRSGSVSRWSEFSVR